MDYLNKLDCLLINLDRSPDRLSEMQERLARFSISFRRIPAVDGKKVEFTEKEINAAEYERCHGKHVTPTEVACYMSHLEALRTFLEGYRDYALILEDDMDFSPDFPFVLEALLKEPSDWDMVKFNGTSNWPLPLTKKKFYKDYRLVFNLLHQAKAGAYLVNRHAASNFLKDMLPMTVPYDHEFLKFWKYDIKLYTVRPFPAWEVGVPSTIDYSSMKKNRKPWYKRFDCYAYRAKIAALRLWHGLKME